MGLEALVPCSDLRTAVLLTETERNYLSRLENALMWLSCCLKIYLQIVLRYLVQFTGLAEAGRENLDVQAAHMDIWEGVFSVHRLAVVLLFESVAVVLDAHA